MRNCRCPCLHSLSLAQGVASKYAHAKSWLNGFGVASQSSGAEIVTVDNRMSRRGGSTIQWTAAMSRLRPCFLAQACTSIDLGTGFQNFALLCSVRLCFGYTQPLFCSVIVRHVTVFFPMGSRTSHQTETRLLNFGCFVAFFRHLWQPLDKLYANMCKIVLFLKASTLPYNLHDAAPLLLLPSTNYQPTFKPHPSVEFRERSILTKTSPPYQHLSTSFFVAFTALASAAMGQVSSSSSRASSSASQLFQTIHFYARGNSFGKFLSMQPERTVCTFCKLYIIWLPSFPAIIFPIYSWATLAVATSTSHASSASGSVLVSVAGTTSKPASSSAAAASSSKPASSSIAVATKNAAPAVSVGVNAGYLEVLVLGALGVWEKNGEDQGGVKIMSGMLISVLLRLLSLHIAFRMDLIFVYTSCFIYDIYIYILMEHWRMRDIKVTTPNRPNHNPYPTTKELQPKSEQASTSHSYALQPQLHRLHILLNDRPASSRQTNSPHPHPSSANSNPTPNKIVSTSSAVRLWSWQTGQSVGVGLLAEGRVKVGGVEEEGEEGQFAGVIVEGWEDGQVGVGLVLVFVFIVEGKNVGQVVLVFGGQELGYTVFGVQLGAEFEPDGETELLDTPTGGLVLEDGQVVVIGVQLEHEVEPEEDGRLELSVPTGHELRYTVVPEQVVGVTGGQIAGVGHEEGIAVEFPWARSYWNALRLDAEHGGVIVDVEIEVVVVVIVTMNTTGGRITDSPGTVTVTGGGQLPDEERDPDIELVGAAPEELSLRRRNVLCATTAGRNVRNVRIDLKDAFTVQGRVVTLPRDAIVTVVVEIRHEDEKDDWNSDEEAEDFLVVVVVGGGVTNEVVVENLGELGIAGVETRLPEDELTMLVLAELVATLEDDKTWTEKGPEAVDFVGVWLVDETELVLPEEVPLIEELRNRSSSELDELERPYEGYAVDVRVNDEYCVIVEIGLSMVFAQDNAGQETRVKSMETSSPLSQSPADATTNNRPNEKTARCMTTAAMQQQNLVNPTEIPSDAFSDHAENAGNLRGLQYLATFHTAQWAGSIVDWIAVSAKGPLHIVGKPLEAEGCQSLQEERNRINIGSFFFELEALQLDSNFHDTVQIDVSWSGGTKRTRNATSKIFPACSIWLSQCIVNVSPYHKEVSILVCFFSLYFVVPIDDPADSDSPRSPTFPDSISPIWLENHPVNERLRIQFGQKRISSIEQYDSTGVGKSEDVAKLISALDSLPGNYQTRARATAFAANRSIAKSNLPLSSHSIFLGTAVLGCDFIPSIHRENITERHLQQPQASSFIPLGDEVSQPPVISHFFPPKPVILVSNLFYQFINSPSR
ncbi:uncharacterized protein BDR25DRAFT_349769 [Lindgomyces ingoldianus]|uniref:Uncharacterized protein n=1 Tax=Lindgomyces ingoldianus TaxID=673940 RepID=A0ACB6RBJ5_9PLEO|nr:uncharacterized protein BDR25DRAFT_349769 [Lindgomyces ingoldianus]KAF2476703.1 hypothetical protein BDR25DRAFT_349769 [Lindgomyces ingoldianus]